MDKTLTFKIEREMTIREYLRQNFSSTISIKIKKEGLIFVNGERRDARHTLKIDDELKLTLKETLSPFPITKQMDVKPIYEDEDVLVVFKGENVPCMPTKKHFENNLFCGLNYLYPNEVFRIVTRLDKDTKGLVLIAKNSLCHSLFGETNITKKYRAILKGKLEKSVTVSAPIMRVEPGIKRIVSSKGKPATTIFNLVGYTSDENSVVDIELLTGRTHQIRVHSAHIGHPVLNDSLYGDGQGEYNSGQELTCYYLKFLHPFTKKEIEIKV